MSPPGSPSKSTSHTLCGRVRAMKPCLKSPLPRPCTEMFQRCCKTVDFGEEIVEEVHVADVWDRTPTEPTKKLTYQEILELKEIQRSLPRANQLDDPISGRPGRQYLSSVPIGLLPLLPDSPAISTTSSPVTSPPRTPQLSPTPSLVFTPPPPPAPSIPRPWAPPHLAHLLPARAQPAREKPKFAFLPLLDTPPSSETSSPFTSNPSSRSSSPDLVHTDTDTDSCPDPPTPSLTNESLDSSPRSRPSSVEPSPEPPYLQLPLLGGGEKHSLPSLHSDDLDHHASDIHYSDHVPDILPSMRGLRINNTSGGLVRPSSLFFPPPLSNTTAWSAFPAKRNTSPSPPRPVAKPTPPSSPPASKGGKKRNIMVLNGVEIDIGSDDEDEDDNATGVKTPNTPSSLSTPLASPNLGKGAHIGTPASPALRGRELPQPLVLPPPAASPMGTPTVRCSNVLCSPIRQGHAYTARPVGSAWSG